MTGQIPLPEAKIAQRPLQFFWLVDHSGSMSGKKIAILNQAIREALPAVREALRTHPEVAVQMRAIKFADAAAWHVGPTPVSVEQFAWPEVTVAGGTSTAQAVRLLASELTLEKMPPRGYPPVCVLLSDGYCTDEPPAYDNAIAELTKLPWGKRAVRLAIGIGDEMAYDEAELLKFVSHPEIGVLKADTPQKLIDYIRWASVAATVGASVGRSKVAGAGPDSQNVVLQPPPNNPNSGIYSLDVF